MVKQEIKSRILEAIRQEPHRNDIQSVALFGSILTGTDTPESDVDVLIDFVPSATVGFVKFSQIRRNLEQHVGRSVDLLTPQALSRFFRDQVLNEAEYIYER